MDYYIDFENYLGSENWGSRRFDYTSGNIDYIGKHVTVSADTADDEWNVWKFTYDGSGNMTYMQGPIVGAWDSRAALGW